MAVCVDALAFVRYLFHVCKIGKNHEKDALMVVDAKVVAGEFKITPVVEMTCRHVDTKSHARVILLLPSPSSTQEVTLDKSPQILSNLLHRLSY